MADSNDGSPVYMKVPLGGLWVFRNSPRVKNQFLESFRMDDDDDDDDNKNTNNIRLIRLRETEWK